MTDSQGQHQFSQELQLNGKALNDRLNYATGLYYFTEAGYVHDFVPFDTGYLYVYDLHNDVKTDSYAVYSHLDFKLTDQWGLTAGGRYSEERKKFLGGQADLDGFNLQDLRLPGSERQRRKPSSVRVSRPSPANSCWVSRSPDSRCATSRTFGTTRTGMCLRRPSGRSTRSPRT